MTDYARILLDEPQVMRESEPGSPRRPEWEDGAALLLSKATVCLAASYALHDQGLGVCLGLVGAACFFGSLALLGASRARESTQP